MAWRTLIGRNAQSVKLFACPTSASSAAARTFYEANYNVVKHLNPTFPFMIRAMPNVEPYLVVEYGVWSGRERVDGRRWLRGCSLPRQAFLVGTPHPFFIGGPRVLRARRPRLTVPLPPRVQTGVTR